MGPRRLRAGELDRGWVLSRRGLPIRLRQIVCQRLQARAAPARFRSALRQGNGPATPSGHRRDGAEPSVLPATLLPDSALAPPESSLLEPSSGFGVPQNLVTACRGSAAGKSANKATFGGKARVGVPWQLQPHLGPAPVLPYPPVDGSGAFSRARLSSLPGSSGCPDSPILLPEMLLARIVVGGTLALAASSSSLLHAQGGARLVGDTGPCSGVTPDSFEPNDSCYAPVSIGRGAHLGLNVSEGNWDYYTIPVPVGSGSPSKSNSISWSVSAMCSPPRIVALT